jgi:hypothetical protein
VERQAVRDRLTVEVGRDVRLRERIEDAAADVVDVRRVVELWSQWNNGAGRAFFAASRSYDECPLVKPTRAVRDFAYEK